MESKEQIMSTSAAKKKTQADAIPPLANNWSLEVDAGFPAPVLKEHLHRSVPLPNIRLQNSSPNSTQNSVRTCRPFGRRG
jgi:hypothetical protein